MEGWEREYRREMGGAGERAMGELVMVRELQLRRAWVGIARRSVAV